MKLTHIILEDKALGNVKLTELPGWLARRNMYSPQGMARAMSRTYWRWNFKYMLPKVCLLIIQNFILETDDQ